MADVRTIIKERSALVGFGSSRPEIAFKGGSSEHLTRFAKQPSIVGFFYTIHVSGIVIPFSKLGRTETEEYQTIPNTEGFGSRISRSKNAVKS